MSPLFTRHVPWPRVCQPARVLPSNAGACSRSWLAENASEKSHKDMAAAAAMNSQFLRMSNLQKLYLVLGPRLAYHKPSQSNSPQPE